jgi:excisionase family DNA binding protein
MTAPTVTAERRRTLAEVLARRTPTKAEWIGWQEVALLTGRGRRAIYRACAARELEATRIGNAWRIRRSSAAAWAAARAAGGGG